MFPSIFFIHFSLDLGDAFQWKIHLTDLKNSMYTKSYNKNQIFRTDFGKHHCVAMLHKHD